MLKMMKMINRKMMKIMEGNGCAAAPAHRGAGIAPAGGKLALASAPHTPKQTLEADTRLAATRLNTHYREGELLPALCSPPSNPSPPLLLMTSMVTVVFVVSIPPMVPTPHPVCHPSLF